MLFGSYVLLQNIMKEQLESLSAELQIKDLRINDQRLLHKKISNIRFNNVSTYYCTQ